MSRYEIVPCKLHHLRALAATLRPEDRAEIETAGLVPRHALIALWRASMTPKAALVDGEVAAAWGDTGTLLGDEGSLWAFTSPAVARLPHAFLREARREIADRLLVRRVLRVHVADSYSSAIRFYALAGFSVGPPVLIGDALYREMRIGRPATSPHAGEDRPFFVIYALPRSRTAWLSAFLSYRDWSCLHEQAIFMRSLRDVRRLLARPRTGIAETAAGPGWRLLRHLAPGLSAVVIRRPVDETVGAMIEAGRCAGASYDEAQLRRTMQYGDRCLAQISALPGTLTLSYSQLGDEHACRQIFEHCLPYRFDREWWASLRDRNIQTDLVAFFRHYRDTRCEVEAFKRACKSELTRLARAGEL